jgi:small nuclear ribonucleoprotein B and B'
LIHYRLKVTLNDSRTLVGQLLAFDKHMNLVIAECEEFRRVKSKKGAKSTAAAADEDDEEQEMKRTLGLVILRGETIVTISVEGPPPAVDESKGPQVRSNAKGGLIRSVPSVLTFSVIYYRLVRDLVWELPLDVVWACRRQRCE